LRVGDLIGLGISHPCTTFDRWRQLVIVDDDYGRVGIANTYFRPQD
jgi:D-serine dehydratase